MNLDTEDEDQVFVNNMLLVSQDLGCLHVQNKEMDYLVPQVLSSSIIL